MLFMGWGWWSRIPTSGLCSGSISTWWSKEAQPCHHHEGIRSPGCFYLAWIDWKMAKDRYSFKSSLSVHNKDENTKLNMETNRKIFAQLVSNENVT
jgi:hypothetical protein